MGGSSKKTTVGYKYSLGMHLILCHGPADKVIRLRVDKRIAWEGNSSGGRIQVIAPGLFGGEEREGGVEGAVDIEMGESSQPKNDYLMARLGSQIPAFRGVVGTVLRQVYLGVNPYLKPWAWTVKRIHKTSRGEPQWYDDRAEIKNFTTGITANLEAFVGGLDAYTLDSGSLDQFSIDQTEKGPGMTTTSEGTAGGDHISRTFLNAVPTDTLFFDFRINSRGNDDTGRLDLSNNGSTIIHFIGSRQVDFDSARRPAFGNNVISGESGAYAGNYAGTNALAIGEWYTVEINLLYATQQVRCIIRQDSQTLSDDTYSAPGIDENTVANRLSFGIDQNTSGIGSTTFANIRFGSAVDTGDMNPAHIIRECLVDSVWGMGYTPADIDDASFSLSADILYFEGMGISLLWDRQIPIEDFVAEIIRHINATLYIDRVSGKFTLKLIRDNYFVDDLITLDESSIEKVSSYSRVDPGDGINSVTVIFKDSLTMEDGSVTVEDIALIQAYGTVVNTTIQYPGFRKKSLAARAAERDLTTLSAPLLSATIEANRVAADLNIGDVFKFEYPDYHQGYIVMRVHQIALGDGRKNRVKITATEDIFFTPSTAIVGDEESGWVEPGGTPLPVPAQLAFEGSYYELCQELGQSTVDSQLTLTPEIGYLQVAASRPENGLSARVWVDDGAGYEESSALDFCPSAELLTTVSATATVFDLSDSSDLDLVRIGSYAEINKELILIESVDLELEKITVARGVLDSIPIPHALGSMLLFWDDYSSSVGTEFVFGEEIEVKVLTASSQGILPIGDAVPSTVVFNQRAILPYRPANLKANGDYPLVITSTPILSLSWNHRDRTQETSPSLISFFEDVDVGPEPGTTYTVRAFDADSSYTPFGDAFYMATGIAGKTHEVNITLNPPGPTADAIYVEVAAVRDGFESLTAAAVWMDLAFIAPTLNSLTYEAPTAPTGLSVSNT